MSKAVYIRRSEEDWIDWKDKVEKSEEHLKNKGELGLVLWNNANTMQADWDIHTSVCLHGHDILYSVCTVYDDVVGKLIYVYFHRAISNINKDCYDVQ